MRLCCFAHNADNITHKVEGLLVLHLDGNIGFFAAVDRYPTFIAVDEINAAGGIDGMKLELLFEDDECNEEKSVSAYNKLMDSGINVVLGAVTSGCSIAVSEESVCKLGLEVNVAACKAFVGCNGHTKLTCLLNESVVDALAVVGSHVVNYSGAFKTLLGNMNGEYVGK